MAVCKNENCDTRASFGKQEKKAEYCKKHAPEEYINVVDKTCKDCSTRPTYGKLGSKLAEYCKDHAPENYADIKNKTCKDCSKRPSYGKGGSKLAEYCKEHSPENYINIVSKTCKNCDKQPYFGYPGGKAEYCKQHKPENYVNVKDKTCLNCDKQPYFGKKGTKKAEYCKEHASEDYVDVKNKTCLECYKRPNYGKKGSRAEYCKEHAPENYVNVISKRCLECDKRPCYGKKGGKAEYCKEHSPEDYVNVVSKTCEKCNTQATFGPLFQSKKHCAKHRNNNEFRKNNPKCEECKEKPVYTTKGEIYPLRCEMHKLEDDINIIEKKCVSCQLPWIIPEDETMCNSCRDFNKPKIRNHKEIKIKNMLDAYEIKYYSHDKIIDSRCSYKRPDFVIDYDFFQVVLEVDENQHRTYPSECEQSRMIQIRKDIGMDVLFIRFNPDNYRNNENKLIRSYTGREKKLLDLLNSLKNTKYRKNPLEVIHLFYDGHDDNIKVEYLNY